MRTYARPPGAPSGPHLSFQEGARQAGEGWLPRERDVGLGRGRPSQEQRGQCGPQALGLEGVVPASAPPSPPGPFSLLEATAESAPGGLSRECGRQTFGPSLKLLECPEGRSPGPTCPPLSLPRGAPHQLPIGRGCGQGGPPVEPTVRVLGRVPLQGRSAAAAVQREEARERQGGGQSWVHVGPLRAETLSC